MKIRFLLSALVLTVATTVFGAGKVVKASSFGFNETDATDCIQKALNSDATTVIIDNVGKEYLVRPLFLTSNKEIIFAKGVRVRALPGAYQGTGDALFRGRWVENVTMRGEEGAVLMMNKADYQDLSRYKHSEWRHTIALNGVKNFRIADLKLVSSGGDGIYLSEGKGRPACEDVVIENVECDSHHRQGISVISAKNLLIRNCKFNNTSGTPPQSGIDIEPNGKPFELVVNNVIENCEFSGNYGSGIVLHLPNVVAAPVSVVIRNCKVSGNRSRGISIYTGAEGKTTGTVDIENCHVWNNNNVGLYLRNIDKRMKIKVKNTIIDNRGENRTAIIFNNGDLTSELEGVEFENTGIISNGNDLQYIGNVGYGIKSIGGKLARLDNNGKPTGKFVNLQKFIERHPSKPELQNFRTLTLDSAAVKPVFPNAKNVKRGWLRTRSQGHNITFVQYVPAAGEYPITFEVGKFVKSEMKVQVTVQDKMDTLLDNFIIRDKKFVYTIKANGPNLYKFTYNTHGDTVTVVSPFPGCGYLANNDLPATRTSKHALYFSVPAGVEDIDIEFRGAPGEPVWVELRNPADQVVDKADKVEVYRLRHKRPANSPAEIWQIYIPRVVEDYTIRMGAPLPPILSTNKQQVMTYDTVK